MVGWHMVEGPRGSCLVVDDTGDAFTSAAACTELERAAQVAASVHLFGIVLVMTDPFDAALWRACLALARTRLRNGPK